MLLFRVAVDNGIKMMTPVMLMESYGNLPAAISTRLSSILIIFSALGTLFAGLVKRKITSMEEIDDVEAEKAFLALEKNKERLN